jgi:hypothetical protein
VDFIQRVRRVIAKKVSDICGAGQEEIRHFSDGHHHVHCPIKKGWFSRHGVCKGCGKNLDPNDIITAKVTVKEDGGWTNVSFAIFKI